MTFVTSMVALVVGMGHGGYPPFAFPASWRLAYLPAGSNLAPNARSWSLLEQGCCPIWRRSQELADAWHDLGAVQLDVGHECFMGQPSHAVFQVEAVRTERNEIRCDLLRDGFWRTDVEGSPWPDLVEEGVLGRDGESADLAEAADDLQVARPELVAGPLVTDGDG